MNIDVVAIVAIVFGAVVLMELMKYIHKEREGRRKALQPGSVGLGELESRMQQAVTAAIEPLREQIDALEHRLERMEPERMLGEGETRAREEVGGRR